MIPEARPLRLAYVRLVQATVAIHMEKIEDPDLAGSPVHLDDVLLNIESARHTIERIAAAENIDLTNEDGE